MIKLDDNLLQELGLGSLPPEEKKKMLAHIYETLEMRVGMALAKQMSDGQLNEFEQFIKSNDEAGALRWLENNFPNYRDVVAAEFEKLKAEVKQNAPQIVAASQQQMSQQMNPGQQPQPGMYSPQPAQSQPAVQQPYAPSQPGTMPPQQPYGPQPVAPQPVAQSGYGPQPQPMQQPVQGQPQYYQSQPQAQPFPGQPQQTAGPQPQPGQPFDPQQQQQTQQPYPPQPQDPQAPSNGYRQ